MFGFWNSPAPSAASSSIAGDAGVAGCRERQDQADLDLPVPTASGCC
jgi:hypothetical protein